MIFRIKVEALPAASHTSAGGHHPLLETPQPGDPSTTLIPWTFGGTYSPLYLSVGDKVTGIMMYTCAGEGAIQTQRLYSPSART